MKRKEPGDPRQGEQANKVAALAAHACLRPALPCAFACGACFCHPVACFTDYSMA